MKTCTKCDRELPMTMFHVADKASGRLRGDCKDCVYAKAKARNAKDPNWSTRRRAARIKYKYGILADEYDTLLASQGGACAICGTVVDYLLHVDHDHETGAVRGLLCKSCNWGLGNFGETTELLHKAVKYLEGSGR